MSERLSNTTFDNKPFDETMVNIVWKKASIAMGHDPDLLRKDCCGTMIKRHEYGNTNTPFGWEVDHIVPVSKGGADFIGNLQPLQWQSNRSKADIHPDWVCAL